MKRADNFYPYEILYMIAEGMGVEVYELLFQKLHGYYEDGAIGINDSLSHTEKYTIMAEELGHHLTGAGDITDQSLTVNIKREYRGRAAAYDMLLPLSRLAEAHERGCANSYEAAEYLGVSEAFFNAAIKHYHGRYGPAAYIDGCEFIFTDESVRVIRKKNTVAREAKSNPAKTVAAAVAVAVALADETNTVTKNVYAKAQRRRAKKLYNQMMSRLRRSIDTAQMRYGGLYR